MEEEFEWLGNCIKCNGRIYYNTVTGEVDRSDCVCDRAQYCQYFSLREYCHNAVGDELCLADKSLKHPDCEAPFFKE